MKLLFVIMSILCLACKNSGSKETDIQHVDTVKVDIPRNKKGELTEMYNRLVFIRGVLGGLDSLESGYPTLQLRLWFEYDSANRHLLVIKKDKNWIAEFYRYAFAMKNDSVVAAKKDVWYPMPKMGWDNFIDSLKTLRILELPDQSTIPDMFYHYNENFVHVEVAQKNSYRCYGYEVPVKHAKKFKEARKMEDIIALIESELGYRRISPI